MIVVIVVIIVIIVSILITEYKKRNEKEKRVEIEDIILWIFHIFNRFISFRRNEMYVKSFYGTEITFKELTLHFNSSTKLIMCLCLWLHVACECINAILFDSSSIVQTEPHQSEPSRTKPDRKRNQTKPYQIENSYSRWCDIIISWSYE